MLMVTSFFASFFLLFLTCASFPRSPTLYYKAESVRNYTRNLRINLITQILSRWMVGDILVRTPLHYTIPADPLFLYLVMAVTAISMASLVGRLSQTPEAAMIV
jgi:archaellum biogenesis protein FlaJ (TadC family)